MGGSIFPPVRGGRTPAKPWGLAHGVKLTAPFCRCDKIRAITPRHEAFSSLLSPLLPFAPSSRSIALCGASYSRLGQQQETPFHLLEPKYFPSLALCSGSCGCGW